MTTSFQAFWVEEQPDQSFQRTIATRNIADLPPGDVLIRVQYSSLNYKDALSASGNKGVTRNYPHTPGIDAAGIVEESSVPAFGPGDAVVVTGFDLGMNTPGGWGQYIRVPASWVVKLPDGMAMYESMMLGTAGFTAALCIDALQQHGVGPGAGELLVTGATGGVGSIAVALLGTLGYNVAAVTGKPHEADFLRALGATTVLAREEFSDAGNRVLLKERWAGVVDAVGGPLLVAAIKATRYGGSVAACGNAASPKLELTVFPFILRGVNLLGIDSVNVPLPTRATIWQRLAGEWRVPLLENLAREVPLDNLEREIDLILQGRQVGRVVVAHR
jgi:acrylyl-CoA reductase (NADPH)